MLYMMTPEELSKAVKRVQDAHPPNTECDFCCDLSSPPRWTFYSEPHQATNPEQSFIVMNMSADWAACDTCKSLIEAGHREALVDYAIIMFSTLNENEGNTLSERQLEMVRQGVKRIHDGFFAHQISRTAVPFSRAS